MVDGGKGKRPLQAVLLAIAMWLIPVGIVMMGMRKWFPPLASEHGEGIDFMMNYLLLTIGALLVVGHAALGYFIWRFGNQIRPSFRMASSKTERRWSVIPVVLMAVIAEGWILVLGLPVWAKIYAEQAPLEALTVEVTAEQSAWNVRYPGADGRFGRIDPMQVTLNDAWGVDRSDPASEDDLILLNEIAVPVNRPVLIRLRSKDVLHSFFLPHFRVKQDAVPGMTIEFWFIPNKLGTYELACAELCGLGHYEMRGLFLVLSDEDYAA